MKLSNFFEKIDKMDMGDVIKDFYKSDAPQFKGKSKKKRRDMAIAAKLSAEESVDESGCLGKQIKKGKAKKESFKEELDLNDGMIGSPDSFYDEEERKEAYEDLQDALQGNYMDDYMKHGVCPNCAGTGYQDGEDEVYNDETDEYEEGNECDGFGVFGCDQGEMVGASWVDIINHDERKAERQRAKDNYPGDEEVIDQIARAVKKLDDPRQMYQYMKADYPFMGMAQRSDLIAKGMKKAGLTEGVLDYLTKGIYSEDHKLQSLQFALATMLGKDMDNSPWYRSKIEDLEKELESADINRYTEYLEKKAELMSGVPSSGQSPFMKSLESITEGEERSIIHDATVRHLIDEFTDRVDDMESLEELHDKMYSELEYLDVDEVVDPDMEVGGQRIGNYATGRVIDILDSGSVMDEVTNSLDLEDLKDRDPVFPMQYEGKSPHKKGTKKYKKHMAAMHAEDVDTDSNEADVSKMLAKALGDPNKWTEMTAPELYAELESLDPDMADVIKLTAKMIYDVKLDENTKDKPSRGDCEPCKGTGYKDGKAQDFKTCPVCDGDGEDPGFGGTKAYEEITLDEDQDFTEEFGILGYSIDEENTFEAEYRGRKVKLNKPMRGDVKKFKVYVKDPKTGNVKKVNFGHGGTSAKRKTMRIRKSNPKARKSFRARHNCDNPGPKTKARYWSCRKW